MNDIKGIASVADSLDATVNILNVALHLVRRGWSKHASAICSTGQPNLKLTSWDRKADHFDLAGSVLRAVLNIYDCGDNNSYGSLRQIELATPAANLLCHAIHRADIGRYKRVDTLNWPSLLWELVQFNDSPPVGQPEVETVIEAAIEMRHQQLEAEAEYRKEQED